MDSPPSRRSSATSGSIPPSEGPEEDEKTLVCMHMYTVKLGETTRGVRSLGAGTAQKASTSPAHQRQYLPSSPATRKPTSPGITTIAFCASQRRLYYGQSSGELCFWPLSETGNGTSRYVGSHNGPISHICIPSTRVLERSCLSDGGLFLSGAVGGDIKIWDYQGKVTLEPTVVVQTLYGHTGTITGLFVHGSYILSSSTDGTVRVWKAVEGRGQLLYPWYDLQAVVATVNGWARSMTYDRSKEVGDFGTYFVSDESGSVTRIVPNTTSLHDSESLRSCPFVVNNQLPKGSHSKSNATAIPCMHDHGVASVRFVGDWRLLLALCYDNCLRAYDTDTGECKFVQANENRCMFTSLEVDGRNGEVLAVDKLGSLFIFCMNTGELIASKKLTQAPIVKICAVLGRERYAVSTERDVSVWSICHVHEYKKLRGGHTRAVVALHACSGETSGLGGAADPDYRVLSAGLDGSVRTWDPYDMSCMRVLHHDFSEISSMAFHEPKDILVTGHDNGDVRLWDMGTGSSQLLRQHTNTVTAVLLVLMKRNEELLITTGYDGMVVVWDILNLRTQPPHMIAKFRVSKDTQGLPLQPPPVPQVPGHESPSAVPSDADGPCCANTRSERVEALVRIQTALDLEPEVLAAAFEVHKKAILTAGNDKVIRVWSQNGNYLGQHVGHTDAVACLTLDANFLFSGSEDCTICVWDAVPASSRVPTPSTVQGVGARHTSITAASPLHPHFEQRDLHLNNSSGFSTTPLKILRGHTRCVTALLTQASTGHLFSCSLDGSLRIWDYVLGTMLLKYGHHEELRCMALRADCPEVVVGTNQASILRYPARIPSTEDTQPHDIGASLAQDSAKPTQHGDASCIHMEEDDEEAQEAARNAARESRRSRYGARKVILPVSNTR